jgi:hypothetical protein
MSLIDRLPQEVASKIWLPWFNEAIAQEFHLPCDYEIYPETSEELLSQIKRACKAMGLPWDGLDPPWIGQRVKYTHPIGLSFQSLPDIWNLPDIRVTSRPPPIESNTRRLLHLDGLCLEASFEQFERALAYPEVATWLGLGLDPLLNLAKYKDTDSKTCSY